MPRLKLSYFDFPGRGEVARLTLALGGIEFEDHRIALAEWPAYREKTRFHAVPVLEVDGESLTQCNAINRYVGRLAGLYPAHPFQAACCDEVMDAVEDVVSQVVTTFGIEDAAELRARREALVDGPIQLYLVKLAELLDLRGGEYFVEHRLTVADLKVYSWILNLRSGVLDHVPRNLPERVAPQLAAHCDRIADHPGVVAYYEARAK